MTRPVRSLLALALMAPWLAVLLGASPAPAATTADGAEYTVPDEVVFGTSIRLEGSGWTHPSGGGSAIIVKFDVRGPGDTPVMTQRDVANPVTGAVFGDKSVHGSVVADANGDWSLTVPLPTLENSDALWFPGETHHVRLLSGSVKDGDTVRSAGADFTVTQATSTCSAESVTLDVAPTAEFGGPLRVRGTGWCHPSDGASVIAVKIDEGAYARLDESLYADRTVWAVIQPDPTTGDFDTTITMPDGTAATSTPALASGAHTLRLLTGTIKAGDRVRSRLSSEIVIGDYRPNGSPDPLDPAALTAGAKNGVKIAKAPKRLTVTVPGARAGDWVYVDVYADGAPRAPWGPTWFRTNAKGVVTLPLKGVTLPEGSNQLTVQSGNQGEVGRLRGWARLKVAAAETGGSTGAGSGNGSGTGSGSGSGTGGTPGSSGASGTGAVSGGAAGVVPAPPAGTPDAPVASIGDLDSGNAGSVTGVLENGVLRVGVPDGTPGAWVHVRLYDAQGSAALGWAALDADKGFPIDVSALGDSWFKLTVQDESGALLGWTGGGIEQGAAIPASAAGAGQPVAAVPADEPSPLLLDIGLSGLGLVSLIGTTTALVLGRGATPRKD